MFLLIQVPVPLMRTALSFQRYLFLVMTLGPFCSTPWIHLEVDIMDDISALVVEFQSPSLMSSSLSIAWKTFSSEWSELLC